MPADTSTRTRIELSTYTEATRRAVYDAVVAIYFSPTPEEIAAAQADPENQSLITYSPDEAVSRSTTSLGRWIVTFLRLEFSPDIPEEFRRELLLVEEVPTHPSGSCSMRPEADGRALRLENLDCNLSEAVQALVVGEKDLAL